MTGQRNKRNIVGIILSLDCTKGTPESLSICTLRARERKKLGPLDKKEQLLTQVTSEVFDKLNPFFYFLPEFYMSIMTGCYDKICPTITKEK